MAPGIALALKIFLFFGMLIGLFGLVVPVFPGVTVIWLLTLAYGIIFDFGTLGAWLFGLLTLLAVIGELSDNVLMSGRAYREGASWYAIVLATLAGLIGSVLLTPLGGIAAALGALYLVEYLRQKDAHLAWRRTKSMAIGLGWAFVARFSIGVVMIVLWIIWAWLGA